jgi:hypothetical protein
MTNGGRQGTSCGWCLPDSVCSCIASIRLWLLRQFLGGGLGYWDSGLVVVIGHIDRRTIACSGWNSWTTTQTQRSTNPIVTVAVEAVARLLGSGSFTGLLYSTLFGVLSHYDPEDREES